RAMLLEDAAVRDRHLPSAKLDDLGAERAVLLVERGTRERVPRRRLAHAATRVPSLAAATVLASSIATVIGPTPPGTGVIHDARARAASKSTSPTSLPLGNR